MIPARIGPQDYLNAELVISHLAANYQIEFQRQGHEMSRDEAQQHFRERSALSLVQKLLLDAGEKMIPKTNPDAK